LTDPRQCRACVHAHPIGDESMECRARAPLPVIRAVTSSRRPGFARAVWPTVEADDWCSWFVPEPLRGGKCMSCLVACGPDEAGKCTHCGRDWVQAS